MPFLLLSVVFKMPNSSLPIPQKLTTHTGDCFIFSKEDSDSVHMLMEINIALVIADSCV